MEIQERYVVHSACATLLLISIATTVRAQTAADNVLPDAPDAAYMLTGASSPDARGWEAGTPSASTSATRPAPSSAVTLRDCPYDRTHARICGVHWGQLIISSLVFNAFQDAGNLYTGYWYRYETTHGKWWDRYIASAAGWRWDTWSDNNPFLDDYVGHPIMGSITNFLWIQNDPKSMTLAQTNTWPYWRRMLRAGAFTTFYSFAWKLGPTGEAAIGHNGDHYFSDEKGAVYTNETGWVELVTTPVGGFLWTLAEDSLDKHVIPQLEHMSRNPIALTTYQFLSPSRGTANILRFRPPWYRDSRRVKANSFFSEPPGPDDERLHAETATTAAAERATPDVADSGYVAAAPARPVHYLPVFPRPGGVHEFGAWWGLSLISGHIWGYAGDVKYMPIDVRYSYEFEHWDHWTMRYSPEVTALAMLDEPVPSSNVELMRKRTYGSGLSPFGFQSDFFPSKRVQPFLSTNGGFIYFMDRVLSPQGSQFMLTADFGAGINIFRKERQAVTIGYRYQHLSNWNISQHNPGTDANTFYVSVSRFRTKGYR
ncbi:MAG TPA: acyloxyacyl hydrolase [Acidobacteriaceae bacterium]